MFDKESQSLIVMGSGSSISRRLPPEGESRDMLAAITTCTGASSAHLFQFDPGPVPFGSSVRRSDDLAPYAPCGALRSEIEEAWSQQAPGAGMFWLRRSMDSALCVRIAVEGVQPICLALVYKLGLLNGMTRHEAEGKAATITPLVQSHLLMALQITTMSRKFDGTRDLLNASHVGMILFDNQGLMIHANDAAQAALDAQDGLRMGSRAPTPVLLKDATRFHLALDHQIAENAAGHKTKRESAVLLIHRQGGRRPFIATLIPTSAPATVSGEAAVMLFLLDPTRQHLDHLAAICELYGLSQVESRLAQHIAAGLTVDEAAATMRIKSPTARTYLKQIFLKTDTHRQADLVRLLMLSTGQITSQTQSNALQ